MMRRRFGLVVLVAAALWGTAVAFLPGCSSSMPNRDPTGETFPRVVGQSLEKQEIVLPDAMRGEPAILLIGYKQRTQFDIDRWLMGLIQAEADAAIVEIPTIPGLVPSMASGWIDDGMRSGIPEEDWGAVITTYGSQAKPVAELTGTENGQLTRVVVLDENGEIVWFDDTGYSVRKAMRVAEIVRALAGATSDTGG